MCMIRAFVNKNWQRPTLPHFTEVPSALKGLTALFGMGRGGHLRYNHHNVVSDTPCTPLVSTGVYPDLYRDYNHHNAFGFKI